MAADFFQGRRVWGRKGLLDGYSARNRVFCFKVNFEGFAHSQKHPQRRREYLFFIIYQDVIFFVSASLR